MLAELVFAEQVDNQVIATTRDGSVPLPPVPRQSAQNGTAPLPPALDSSIQSNFLTPTGEETYDDTTDIYEAQLALTLFNTLEPSNSPVTYTPHPTDISSLMDQARLEEIQIETATQRCPEQGVDLREEWFQDFLAEATNSGMYDQTYRNAHVSHEETRRMRIERRKWEPPRSRHKSESDKDALWVHEDYFKVIDTMFGLLEGNGYTATINAGGALFLFLNNYNGHRIPSDLDLIISHPKGKVLVDLIKLIDEKLGLEAKVSYVSDDIEEGRLLLAPAIFTTLETKQKPYKVDMLSYIHHVDQTYNRRSPLKIDGLDHLVLTSNGLEKYFITTKIKSRIGGKIVTRSVNIVPPPFLFVYKLICDRGEKDNKDINDMVDAGVLNPQSFDYDFLYRLCFASAIESESQKRYCKDPSGLYRDKKIKIPHLDDTAGMFNIAMEYENIRQLQKEMFIKVLEDLDNRLREQWISPISGLPKGFDGEFKYKEISEQFAAEVTTAQT